MPLKCKKNDKKETSVRIRWLESYSRQVPRDKFSSQSLEFLILRLLIWLIEETARVQWCWKLLKRIKMHGHVRGTLQICICSQLMGRGGMKTRRWALRVWKRWSYWNWEALHCCKAVLNIGQLCLQAHNLQCTIQIQW